MVIALVRVILFAGFSGVTLFAGFSRVMNRVQGARDWGTVEAGIWNRGEEELVGTTMPRPVSPV